MTPWILAVLAASLAGSPHCAGMCGGFAWIAAPGPGPRGALAVLYHGSRLAGYLAIGALAGLAGQGLDALGAFAGAGRTAALLAGVVMVTWGLVLFAGAAGIRVPRLRLPAGGPVIAVGKRLVRWPPALRAALIGLVTALLPCGLLYGFAAMAAGTGSVAGGAITMLVFWAGTLPAFALLSLAARRLAGPAGRHLPLVTATAMIVVGTMTLLGRIGPAASHAHGMMGHP